jgi:hypothetical protein
MFDAPRDLTTVRHALRLCRQESLQRSREHLAAEGRCHAARDRLLTLLSRPSRREEYEAFLVYLDLERASREVERAFSDATVRDVVLSDELRRLKRNQGAGADS